MKKIFMLSLLILLMIPAMVFAKPLNVISMGVDRSGNETAAMDKMCLNAAGHSLAFIIPPNTDPNSEFVKIVKTYYKDVTSNVKVQAKKKDGSVIILTGEVTVDFDKLRDIVHAQIKNFQEANTDDRAMFLVRIVGIENSQLLMRAYGDVLQTYGMVFENLGFKVDATDELITQLISSPANEDFASYCRRMNDEAGNVGCKYVVIGEIFLEKASEGETGVIWKSTARLQARDFGNSTDGTIIFQFDDDYKLRGKDDNVAFFALRKAAMNSSRALAEHTLAHWKSRN